MQPKNIGDGSEYNSNHWAIMDPGADKASPMTPDAHQYNAYVTAPKTYKVPTFKQMELIHAVLGLASELGEIADTVKKHIIYGQVLDEENLVEEVGDSDWYAGLLLTAINELRSVAMEKNIAKLKRRYPDGFTELAATARADKQVNPNCPDCGLPLETNTFDTALKRPGSYLCRNHNGKRTFTYDYLQRESVRLAAVPPAAPPLPPNTVTCQGCQGTGYYESDSFATKKQTCPGCEGKGYVPIVRDTCQHCDGLGQRVVVDGGEPILDSNKGQRVTITCPDCGGTGRNR